MSLSPSAKALGEGASEARVWVYSNNVLVPNPATVDGYYSASVSGDSATVTVKDLAPGENYRVVAVAGVPQTGGTFVPSAFGTSDLFGIKAGVETSVSMTLKTINITPALSGINLKSVVLSDKIYTADSTRIYYASNIGALSANTYRALSSGTINSLNLTADDTPRVLINTSQGVSILRQEDIESIGSWGGETPPNVLQSGGLDSAYTYFYQADKELGGIVGANISGEKWNRIKIELEALAGKPILDLLIIRKDADTFYGYFATRVVGAFKVGSNKIKEIDLEAILKKEAGGPISFFGESLPLIQAFGYIEKDVSKTLYVGTKNGVYYTTDLDTLKGFTLLEGTKGLNIIKVIVQGTDEAFLTSKEIVILKGGSKVYKMPFLTSVVGDLTDIAWNGTDLLVTGTKGICSVPTSDL